MKLRKILILLGSFLIAVVLISILRHYQLRAATNAYIAELKARGELLEIAQVLPPRLAPEENSADTMRKAAALIKADQTLLATNYYYAMKMVAPGKAMVGSQQPEARDYEVTNSWKEVEEALAENKAVFPLLWSFVEKPKFDFDINYSNGISDINFANFCLTESKRAAGRLQVAALSDLHRGDSASAVKNVRAMLAIANGMADERLVISELVRIAITQMAMNATWEILQSTNVTEEHLAALQNDWAGLEFFHAEDNALNMERASSAISIKKYRSSNSIVMHDLLVIEDMPWLESTKSTAMDRLRLKSRVLRWRYWWSYPDELRALKGYQALLAAPRSTGTNYALLATWEDLLSNINKLSIPPSGSLIELSAAVKMDMHFLLSSSIVTLSGAFKRAMTVETARQLATAAIALKRYYLKHTAYPADLAALAPEFLAMVPRDPIDGQPLRYRLNADGTFLLYSIGDDGKDDGGDPGPSKAPNSLQWQLGRDWVWPQPAAADEIQKFGNNPPK